MKAFKLKLPIIDENVLMADSIKQNLTSNLIREKLQKEAEFIINQLKLAIPQIKGEITKGKLKWRGIKIIETHNLNGTTKWIEQRGKQIGERLEYKIILKDNPKLNNL